MAKFALADGGAIPVQTRHVPKASDNFLVRQDRKKSIALLSMTATPPGGKRRISWNVTVWDWYKTGRPIPS
jgi:hypothetical protein